jgi:uncharacterized protein YneF (UPF0154 family)
MSIETYITASMLLGFALGMWISRTAIRERDKRIAELENELGKHGNKGRNDY